MSRPMKNREETKRGMLMLKLLVGKIQRSLSLSPPRGHDLNGIELDEKLAAATTKVPDDVKKGHFAVFAAKGGEPNRLIIELEHLTNPAFLRLLEQAKEEYGFTQKGALVVPCRSEELQKTLGDRREKIAAAGGWTTSNVTIVECC